MASSHGHIERLLKQHALHELEYFAYIYLQL